MTIDLARDRVVITGAAGAIGTALRRGLAGQFANLLFTDLHKPADAPAAERWVTADISDRPALDTIMAGAAAVVHLAGAASSDLETLFRINAGEHVTSVFPVLDDETDDNGAPDEGVAPQEGNDG